MAVHRQRTRATETPHSSDAASIEPVFVRAGELRCAPQNRLPRGTMPADSAYQIIHDELMLDGNARLNLATFVTTWMDDEARRLM